MPLITNIVILTSLMVFFAAIANRFLISVVISGSLGAMLTIGNALKVLILQACGSPV